MPARILVIEDNRDNLELLTFLLTSYGHAVLTAQDGQEGLEIARRELPDVVLSDLQMPIVDGYAVARALRNDPRLGKCPLIAVSSYAMRGDRERALQAGFDGYISKPIAPEEFVGQVERFLRIPQRAILQLPPDVERQIPAKAPHRGTILAVDNSSVNLSLIQSTLEPFGYIVIAAATAREALEIASTNPPDLILSDLHMPDVDGYEFFEMLRTTPKLELIPFVLTSSTLCPQTDITRALNMGVGRLIVRPIDPQQLLAEIETCLAEAAHRRLKAATPGRATIEI
jgi:two-component system, cell cycle response regulator